MIPARIAEARKKYYTIPDGNYIGLWDGHFCWIYKPGTKEIFHRFETTSKIKPKRKRGESVNVVVSIPRIYIYEILTK